MRTAALVWIVMGCGLALILSNGACSSGGTTTNNENSNENANDNETTDNINDNGSGEDTNDNDNENTVQPQGGETLFIGTGEYSRIQDWHAILRIDGAEQINSAQSGEQVTPNSTVNVQQSESTAGVALNFAHGLFIDEERDELYASAIFTTDGEDDDCNDPGDTQAGCGSIAVFANASSMDGPQTLVRHIFGDQTEVVQPHGLYVDTSRDILYVASTFGQKITMFDSASTADGNVPPDRVLEYEDMGAPVHVYVDDATDRLFIASLALGVSDGRAAILVYNDASTLDGEVTPDLRIAGDNTRLDEGNNQTTHNVWFAPTDNGELLFVGHHTNEVLIFNLTGTNWDPQDKPEQLDITPRVLRINEESDNSDESDWSCYGFFYVKQTDRLYVAAGYTPPNAGGDNPPPSAKSRGTLHGYDLDELGDPFSPAQEESERSGPPQPGCPNNKVKVYDNVSDPGVEGVYPADAEIYWDNCDQFYPPQPLWVLTD